MRMGTQQQYNNQDRYVNEFAPPRTWTLLSSSQVYYLKKIGHRLILSLIGRLDNI